MAITFTSHNPDAAGELVIGGVDSSGQLGGYGPFPTYSISREEIYSGDDTYLNTRYTISINGSATIKPADSANAMIKGQRQSRVQGEAIIKLQFNRDTFPMVGNGTLSIESYDGGSNIEFKDARLTSVSTPNGELTSSVNYQQYSFTFEAYNINDHGLPTYILDSVEESWNLSVNDGQFAFSGSDIKQLPLKTFTLTHTLSATGKQKPGSTEAEAWRQAAQWVQSRLVNYPTTNAVTSHVNNAADGPEFVPFYMNSESNKDDLKLNAETKNGIVWRTYNPNRTPSISISDGTYSVTDTWVVAPVSSKALHTLNAEVNADFNATSTVVSVNGQIQGLNSYLLNSGNDNKNNAYENALAEYNIMKDYIYPAALNTFNNLQDLVDDKTYPLRPNPISRSVGDNKTAGLITWSETYNNDQIIGNSDCIMSQQISLNYSNRQQNVAKIAIIPVIGKSDGPIFQTFNTEVIRNLSLTIDVVVKPGNCRNLSSVSQIVDSIAAIYKPENSYVSSRSSNYDPAAGSYSLSLEWQYK
jgi:hypothetical protein